MKFDPAMVTEEPIAPLFGDKPVMLGAGVTVNGTPEVCTPPASVTTTLPEIATAGTLTVIELVVQLMIVAAVPANFT